MEAYFGFEELSRASQLHINAGCKQSSKDGKDGKDGKDDVSAQGVLF